MPGLDLRSARRALIVTLFAAVGCAPRAPSATPGPDAGPNDARGGRLYDNWVKEKRLGAAFSPDSKETAALDGRGGPHGTGALSNAAGQPLANTGHDYRLKNLFGWDMRGKDGIYGPEYQNKAYVVGTNLLTDPRGASELRTWLEKGDERIPAYGQVLDARDLDDLTHYIVKTRAGELPQPAQVFRLEKSAPKGYVLESGGDAARGRATYATRCAGCHGASGTKIAIDETESVGTLTRSSGYEVWFKILNGHPGSNMGRQVVEPNGTAGAQAILDLMAALCDRKTYPARSGAEDVPDGDPRCGAYLR